MLGLLCGAQRKSALPFLQEIQPTGAFMKFSISYKHVEAHEAVETDTAHAVEKLSRLLKFYEPDLVQLHGVFSQNPHKEEHSFSLNLSLPTGTLHATGTGENVRAALQGGVRRNRIAIEEASIPPSARPRMEAQAASANDSTAAANVMPTI